MQGGWMEEQGDTAHKLHVLGDCLVKFIAWLIGYVYRNCILVVEFHCAIF